jgi:uncharacterized protein YndB with AHSA1/START domain
MVTAAEELTLQITRKFTAPVERVYAAWTIQDQVEQWLCRDQKASVNRCLALDVRPNGRLVIDIRTPEGDAYRQHGTFVEIIPMERLVFTWFYEKTQARGIPTDLPSPKTLVTVEFHPAEDCTEVSLIHEQFASRQEYEGTLAAWNGCFEVLDQLLLSNAAAS